MLLLPNAEQRFGLDKSPPKILMVAVFRNEGTASGAAPHNDFDAL